MSFDRRDVGQKRRATGMIPWPFNEPHDRRSGDAAPGKARLVDPTSRVNDYAVVPCTGNRVISWPRTSTRTM